MKAAGYSHIVAVVMPATHHQSISQRVNNNLLR
nr:MAG TPA: hypothetical protein [Caudoviricetes sp.]